MIKKLYFCETCRKKLDDISEIHFVEEDSDRGFCSEDCILDFYRPYMQEFEKEEELIRAQLNLAENEGHNEILANEHYLELALKQPHEVWIAQNELEQCFYTHILNIQLNGDNFYFILICSYIDNGPAFVFYRTLTSSYDLVKHYKRDKPFSEDDVPEPAEKLDVDISDDIIEEIELKKSSLLAYILQMRTDEDIPLENFLNYDNCLEKTLNNPDEIYEYEDEDSDILKVNIKSFHQAGESFFYLVILYSLQDEQQVNYSIPILGFPSTDKNLYKYFATGKRLNETLKN